MIIELIKPYLQNTVTISFIVLAIVGCIMFFTSQREFGLGILTTILVVLFAAVFEDMNEGKKK